MKIVLSSVFGELATRSMSLFISKYSKQAVQAIGVSLERILLRGQAIIDEAEGRHITNQGMLRQLGMLRDSMYKGFYVLDTLTGSEILKMMLEILRSDVTESVMFLTTYPRLHHHPYSMHLLLENCMFGCQMELELILNFMLHTPPCSSRLDKFDVLPIVGPGSGGKSTLVAHVCNDERVRNHFSRIAFLTYGSFRDEDMAILTDGCRMRRAQDGKLLIVFEVAGELDEDLWERLCSLSTSRTASGSKIIRALTMG
ncbi:hypothetical protein ACQ4PT_043920 [Festuca glaucescens]